MLTHLLVVDLKHLEDRILLPVFHRGHYSPELHYINSSATEEGEAERKGKQRGRGVRGFQGSWITVVQRDLDPKS